MERVKQVHRHLTSGSKAPDSPELIKEVNRQKIQPKKIQVVEDQRRVIADWKEKSDLDGHSFAMFQLGELYQWRKQVNAFVTADPDFNNYREYKEESRDVARNKVNLLLAKTLHKFKFNVQTAEKDWWKQATVFESIGASFGPVATKMAVHCFLYAKSILALGNRAQINKYVQRAYDGLDMGCFGLTEVGHGSNIKGTITTAIYEPDLESFVINTPHERGSKFWIGNAAQTANMSIIAANMIVLGKDYGLHFFLVPLRDNNHNLMTGVSIADCGDKMGLKGVDNGMIRFRSVKVPRENLLDRVTQVAPDGTVTSIFSKKSMRFASQLGALSDGRVKISLVVLTSTQLAAGIACRYLAVRRQFGSERYDETQLLNYPAVQNRIFPKYARASISYFGTRAIANVWAEKSKNLLDPAKMKEAEEMHAIISAIKPLNTWLQLGTTLEARAICGGLGYSSYSGLPTMHCNNHVNSTWEGDNSVLLQQTARFIMKGLGKLSQGKNVKYTSVDYLTLDSLAEQKLDLKDLDELKSLDVLLKVITFAAAKSAQDGMIQMQVNMGATDTFHAWNQCLPNGLESAAKLFGLLYLHRVARTEIQNCPVESARVFFERLFRISALKLIEEYSGYLLNYMDIDQMKHIREILAEDYKLIKYDVVKSLDYLEMSDTMFQSALGSKDGNVYDRLISDIHGDRRNFGRPPFWREVYELRNGRGVAI